MKWTKQKPTTEGWYWCDHLWPHIVWLMKTPNGLMWDEPYESEDDLGNLCVYNEGQYVHDTECNWSSELKKPVTVDITKYEDDDLCPDCKGILEDGPGGGVRCTNADCGYWFCF